MRKNPYVEAAEIELSIKHIQKKLRAKEMEGAKVILPIWHHITKDEVMQFSPTMVDKVALNSALLSIGEIATKVANAIMKS